jgi:hypothetical protein
MHLVSHDEIDGLNQACNAPDTGLCRPSLGLAKSDMAVNQRIYRRFRLLVAPRERDAVRALYRLFQVAAAAFVLVFAINLLSIGKSSFGEWGDFFGGVLNPVFTFLTFMGLLVTIVLQQTELREARAEMKRSADALHEQNLSLRRQTFEATFFQMLSVHTGIVSSVDLTSDEGKVTRGRDCFSIFYTRLTKIYRANCEKAKGKHTDEQVLRLSYRLFWRTHQVELGHYFRYLYNVVRFIKESDFVDGPYLRLVRAQLSDQEALLLFYNCIASDYGANFKQLAEEFALLDNMPRVRVLNESHLELIDGSAFKRRGEPLYLSKDRKEE